MNSRLDRYAYLDARPRARCGHYLQTATKQRSALPHPEEPPTAGPASWRTGSRVEAPAIVLDLQGHAFFLEAQAQEHVGSPGVPGDVGDRLLAGPEDGVLQFGRQAPFLARDHKRHADAQRL